MLTWTKRIAKGVLVLVIMALILGFGYVQWSRWSAKRALMPNAPGTNGQAVPGARACMRPPHRTPLIERNGAILETWELALEDVRTTALPQDPAFLEYRTAIEGDGADLRRPVADPPRIETEAEAAVWRDEFFNNDLAYDEGVGSIDPISCLDALLFARQAGRVSQIEQPTEFLASVLRRDGDTGTDLLVVFGAGSEMFVPRDFYGLDVVRSHLADGWEYWYALHNHTVQKNGASLALGVPVPSTSDVALSRALHEDLGLESVRVTNGFYTFQASVEELAGFRGR